LTALGSFLFADIYSTLHLYFYEFAGLVGSVVCVNGLHYILTY
jgi:hypothetical protein